MGGASPELLMTMALPVDVNRTVLCDKNGQWKECLGGTHSEVALLSLVRFGAITMRFMLIPRGTVRSEAGWVNSQWSKSNSAFLLHEDDSDELGGTYEEGGYRLYSARARKKEIHSGPTKIRYREQHGENRRTTTK
jgi:hypothetical protein